MDKHIGQMIRAVKLSDHFPRNLRSPSAESPQLPHGSIRKIACWLPAPRQKPTTDDERFRLCFNLPRRFFERLAPALEKFGVSRTKLMMRGWSWS
jgi:hypothetical protein